MFETAIGMAYALMQGCFSGFNKAAETDWSWTPPGPLNLYEIHPDPKSCAWYEWDHANVPALQPKISYTKKQLEDMMNLSPETFTRVTIHSFSLKDLKE